MSTTNQIADSLEESGIPFVRVAGVADGIKYWGLTVIHDNIHAEVRECADWVEMKVWHYTPEQFMNMLTGIGTCRNISDPPSGFLCSECGWGDFNEPTHLLKDAKHCPNCGAKVVTE